MKNKLPACIATAAFALILFACLETTNSSGDTTPIVGGGNPQYPSQNPDDGNQEGQPPQYTYCVFPETELCIAGPFIECPPSGLLNNECPSSFLGAGSGAHINPNENGEHNYCIFPEIQLCLKGPFAECPPNGQSANECPYISAENSSSSQNASSSSSQNSSSSSSQNSSSSSIQNASSSSSEDSNPPCKGFNPNEQVLHQGKMKKQICDERDGTKYVYVPIGNQKWLAENLRYNPDGNMGLCYYWKNNYCTAYGRLYRFTEMFCSSGDCESRRGVADPDKLDGEVACPYGWHLPSTSELEELWTYADPNFGPGAETSGRGNNIAGNKLKATSWGGGTDDYGFAALPGGYCGSGCSAILHFLKGPESYYNEGFGTSFWHYGFGAPVPLTKSWQLSDGASVDDAFQSYGTSAFYVRCVQNRDTIPIPETPPSSLDCSGSGTAGQICHLGKWKSVFTDGRDGEIYPYVEIGSKTWMAKNLNFDAGEGSGCYNRLEANCDSYGKLYNWNTMMAGETTSETNPSGRKGVCPEGWHLPSDAEWTELLKDVGGTGSNNLNGASNALKAKTGWGQNGADTYGFAALPGSYGVSLAGYYSKGGFGTAKGSFFWSASTANAGANGAQIRHIGPTDANVKRTNNDKSRLYSVRCVMDEP